MEGSYMRRLFVIPALVLSLLVAGCGGSSTKSTTGAGASTSSGQTVAATAGSTAAATSTAGTSATGCPTTGNTKSFAKTRFVADVGGALFLANRYVLQPYKAGKFTKGAHGRTLALIKAATAVAATTKLLKNAQSNAQANPTLCKAVSGPLSKLTSAMGGLTSGLKSGSLSTGALTGIGGLLGTVKSGAAKAGIPVNEQSVPLR